MIVYRWWIAAPGETFIRSPYLATVERVLAAQGIEFWLDDCAPNWYAAHQRWLTFYDRADSCATVRWPWTFGVVDLESAELRVVRNALEFGALIMLVEEVRGV